MPAVLASDWPRVTGAESSLWRDSPEVLTRLETGPQWGHRQWFRWEESSNHRNGKLNFPRMISQSWKHDRKLSVLIFLRPALERKYQVTLSYIRKIANALKVRAPYFGSIKLLLLELVTEFAKHCKQWKETNFDGFFYLKQSFLNQTQISSKVTQIATKLWSISMFLFFFESFNCCRQLCSRILEMTN